MLTPIIREDLLYYLWKTKSFDMTNLVTNDGQKVEIKVFGNQNHDAGPDFSNARILIDNTEWVGNVEMHVYSSDWERHGHDLDKAYDTVILHVVYEHDKEVFTSTEQLIPVIELKDRIPASIKKNYSQLIANDDWIPCEQHLHKVPEHTIQFWLHRLVANRLEEKTAYLNSILKTQNGNWEETTYIFMARYLGARVNMDPFESLAKSLPLSILLKNKDNLKAIEALLYGQAGMLQADFKDEYFQQLKEEYAFQSKKYNLNYIPPVSWKFARMRPIGFPTIRIGLFAQIIYRTSHLFSAIINTKELKELKKIFVVQPSDYWDDHYRFGTVSTFKEKPLGDSLINTLIINVVAPVLFLYGKSIDDEQYCELAISHLEAIKGEKNNITKKFQSLGVKCTSAADSQALLELKKNYCDKKLCMLCSIGNKLIGG